MNLLARSLLGRDQLRTVLQLRGAALVGGAQVFAILAQLLVLKLLSNLLAPSDFGLYVLVLALGIAPQWLLFGPLEQTALRFYQESQEQGRVGQYLQVIGTFAAAATLISVLTISILWMDPADDRFAGSALESRVFVTFALSLGTVQGLLALGTSILNASRQRGLTSLFVLLGPSAQAGSVGMVYAMGRVRLDYLLLGFLAALNAVLLGLIIVIVCLHRPRMRSAGNDTPPSGLPMARAIPRYAMPFVLWAVPTYAMFYVDRWVLARFTDNETVAVYGVMTVLTMTLMNSAMAALHRGLTPDVFALAGPGDESPRTERAISVVRSVTYVGTAAIAPLLIIYYLWPDGVISLVSSRAYGAASEFLWILLFTALLFGLSQQAALTGMVLKRTASYLWIRLAAGAAACTVVPLLGAARGLAGVIYGVLAVHAFHFTAMTSVNARMLKRVASAATRF